jgi:hypothetical protein
MFMQPNFELAMKIFSKASAYCVAANLTAELEWQRDRSFDDFTETDLLKETAWVILCSGFRESTIRKLFDYISLSFCDWESAASISNCSPACLLAANAVFGNKRKLDAIAAVAKRIDSVGFAKIKELILANPITELQKFSFIGPITAWHLAKNLGLPIAKPDRHLIKLANRVGYGQDVQKLCLSIADATGETVGVVDLILWRYIADLSPNIALRAH